MTKLHHSIVPTIDLDYIECPCSSRYYRENENCLLQKHKETEEKCCLDEKKLITVKALLTPKEQIQCVGKRRVASTNVPPEGSNLKKPKMASSCPADVIDLT